MDVTSYITLLGREICDRQIRKEIQQELQDHIMDQAEAYIKEGMDMKNAYAKAVQDMGEPEEVGRQLNEIHRKYIDWSMLLYFLCWSAALSAIRLLMGYYKQPLLSNDLRAGEVGIMLAGCVTFFAGIFCAAFEKIHDLPTLYAWGKNWRGCAFSNSGLLFAVTVMGFSKTPLYAVIMIIFLGVLMTVERAFIAHKKNQNEERLLWKVGIADTEVTYKGKGTFEGKTLKIAANKGDSIPRGSRIIICDMEGFKPIVQVIKEEM